MNKADQGKCFEIVPRFYLYMSLLLLAVPIRWIVALLVAISIHELGHFILIKVLGASVTGIRIDVGGAAIESTFRNAIEEMICAAAGPIFSIAAVLLSRKYPEIAICACVQAAFNLLPILPLDGGRIIACMLSLLMKRETADRVMGCLAIVCLLIFAGLAVILTVKKIAGIIPALCVIIVLHKYQSNKNSLQR